MAQPAVPSGAVIRFAVAMRGGVSLAVWIGGALAEIDRVRRRAEDDTFVSRLLGATRFERLEVDILTGASAGGLNAALGGMAIARGVVMDLRQVWLDTADIDALLDPPRDAPMHSLLNGRYFLDAITAQLRTLASHPSADAGASRPVEVFLSATVFGGIEVSEPGDPDFVDARREAYFHFRHLACAPSFSDIHDDPQAPDRMGCAARSTASFPVAFEPVEVSSSNGFSGRLHLPPANDVPASVRLYDGGIVDNIPVTRAIRAAASSPAQSAVRRWIVFLHPSPSADSPGAPGFAGASTVPSVPKVIADLLGGIGVETLLDDLEVLREHNRESEAYRIQRLSMCEAAFKARRGTYGDNVLASVDAHHLYAMLDDPRSHLAWIPIGVAPPESPLADDDDVRFHLRMELLDAVSARKSSIRPFARVARIAHLLIEWTRWVERRVVSSQPEVRRRVYDTLLVAQLLDAALDMVAIRAPGDRVAALSKALERCCKSEALHALVDELDAMQAAPGEDWVPLRDRPLPDPARSTLDLLAGGELPTGGAVAGRPPFDAVLLARLASAASELLGAVPSVADVEDKSLFVLLHTRLGAHSTVESIVADLITIDGACGGLHRGRAVGAPMSMEYFRVSGASTSPLVGQSFTPGVLPTLTSVTQGPTAADPKSKLAGNGLANFSAFVSARFRANDWMWGRMDAAAGVVDIFLQRDHLGCAELAGDARVDAVMARLQDAVQCPLAVSDRVPAAIASSVEQVCAALWDANEALITNEVRDALTGSDEAPMRRARDVLTARWQLELFVEELGAILAAPLQPGDRPELPPVVKAPDDIETARNNIAAWMSAYDRAPRRLSQLWGRRKTTALGVRAARGAARALVPGGGLVSGAGRVLLAAPLMVGTAAVMLRGFFLVASALLANFVLVPRLSRGGGVAFVAGGGCASFALWWVLVRRREGAWRARVALGLTAACYAYGLLGIVLKGAGFEKLPPMRAKYPWSIPSSYEETKRLLVSAAIVGVASFAASVLLWWWARPKWRAVVAVGAGVLMAAWVVLGTWDATKTPRWLSWLSALGSLWVPALFLLVSTTTVAVGRWWPEDRPRRPKAVAPAPGVSVSPGS